MIKIEIFVAVDEDNQIEAAKVRKIVIGEDGIARRYGLSLVTGEWILVPEGKVYPTECLQVFPSGASKVVDIPIE